MNYRERGDLVEAVKSDVLALRDEGPPASSRGTHYASDAMKQCFRYFWLDWHNTPPTNPYKDLGTFPIGLAAEDIIVDRMKVAGRYVADQVRMAIPRSPIPINGRIDLIMDDTLKGRVRPSWKTGVPVEIKSIKDWGERQGWTLWKKFLPKEEHVAQLTIYLHRLIELGKIKKDYGYVWYFNKNRANEEAVYQIPYDPDYVERIWEWYDDLEALLFKPEIPPIPKGFKPDRYPCGWASKARDKEELVGSCKYHTGCWITDKWGGGEQLDMDD